ncbi:hypothetical protein SLEP1_g58440 [Rubroshorea leprosula]|uniref:Uncharacterized protein n=1 Tax=Rubroshorea leprosula TaxID=152421 RepID=A0AAV5MPA3_9ROSI|nr:hypothetical protein SLEP1_g58440 [Rubroshorea leprosula]
MGPSHKVRAKIAWKMVERNSSLPPLTAIFSEESVISGREFFGRFHSEVMTVTAMRSELETRMKPNNRKTTMKPVIAKMSMHSLMESYRNRERERGDGTIDDEQERASRPAVDCEQEQYSVVDGLKWRKRILQLGSNGF